MERSRHTIKNFFRLLFVSGKKQNARDYIIGMGSIFDISGSYYNENKTNECTDWRAMQDDWKIVGNDIRTSLKFHLSEISDPESYESAKRKLSHNC